ncbi:uncharacterized protein LOC111026995 [Myzus persicae]|uniref:uncharacterized protein LOC111026995 n=1 Tax=Myzus persicae TaxID=13164 RepID=UPI000B93505E|nr:uncharacterized protein LOC111026995 [Myzus persicae]
MPRQNASPRVSRRNKRKLHIDYLNETSLERDVDLCEDLSIDVTNDSQTSLEGHRDLFGELIPEECVSDKVVQNKSIRKTPGSKKKKLPHEELLFDTPPRPNSLMDASARSSNVSIASTDSLNVSGVERLQDSPVTTGKNESKIHIKEEDNEQKSSKVLEGVIGFVDYKIDSEHNKKYVSRFLTDLGAKVAKTFNRKVTHVIFCDGSRSTYKKAVERDIPLVSAMWIHYSKLSNKIQDPADYPPVGMDKYTTTPSRKIIIPVSNFQ